MDGTEQIITGKKICIVTQLHSSMNPRVVKEADALSKAGYQVSIIAPEFSEWGKLQDKAFEHRLWRIVARPQFGPRATRIARLREFARRTLAQIALSIIGTRSMTVAIAACHPVAPLLVAATKRQSADLYIAHYPSALAAVAIAARRHNALYAFDAEDFHQGDLPSTPEHESAKQVISRIESAYLPGCCYVSAAAPGIAQAYADTYAIQRPITIRNVFPKRNAPTAPTPKGNALLGPSIYWYSQTIGHDRGLQCAIRAISRAATQPHLYLRGAVSGSIRKNFEAIARECNVLNRLHFLPPEPPNMMEQLASLYDVGLCGEIGATENRKIALTNKQFTYLLAGIPVLMSDITAHRDFRKDAIDAVALFAVNDADSLAQTIDHVLGDLDRLAFMRASAWRYGQMKFNWDTEQGILLDQVQRVLNAKFKP
ncbi:MAG: hypothetical protein CTY31_02300 [Hyphomicrobium sp.]|nr:MAG: hypothetical protein CTY39_12200 [Hyphomicrobium sp.]PPD01607.1 MAG: hypothetical protein CTY31_02300 [Hyphomicrobium sp.]